MSPAVAIALLAVAVSVLAIVIASRRSGPRVTHIDTHHETRKDESQGE